MEEERRWNKREGRIEGRLWWKNGGVDWRERMKGKNEGPRIEEEEWKREELRWKNGWGCRGTNGGRRMEGE
jgi:hypothetical protein